MYLNTSSVRQNITNACFALHLKASKRCSKNEVVICCILAHYLDPVQMYYIKILSMNTTTLRQIFPMVLEEKSLACTYDHYTIL